MARDRIFLDAESHRLCPQITASLLSGVIRPNDTVISLATSTPDDFYAQLVHGDPVTFYKGVRNNAVRFAQSVVNTTAQADDQITLESPITGATITGESYPVFCAPPAIAFKVIAYDAVGTPLDSSAWIPVTGTIATALRNHTVFSAGA